MAKKTSKINSSLVAAALRTKANPVKAKFFLKFFKTGPGEYGARMRMLGLTVPIMRTMAREFKRLPLPEIKKMLHSPIHEHRFTALEILVMQYENGDKKLQEKIAKFYLANTKQYNNWDLVDTSAPYILGAYLFDKSRAPLYRLAQSKNLWERRVAMVSTFYFINQKDCVDTTRLVKILLSDHHDLIHKACGWMLREVGKNCGEPVLKKFLRANYNQLPRTTLRYAIERFSKSEQKNFLSGRFARV